MSDPNAVQAGLDAEFEALQEARRRIEASDLSPQEREVALGRLAEREMAHVRRVQAETQRQRDNEVMQSKVRTAQAQGGIGVRHTASGGVEVQHQAPEQGVPEALRETTDDQATRELVAMRRVREQADADPRMTPERRLRIEQELRAREAEIYQQLGGTADPAAPPVSTAIRQAAQGAPVVAPITPVDTAPQQITPVEGVPPMLARPGAENADGVPPALARDPRGTVSATTVAGTPRRRSGAAAPAAPPAPPALPGKDPKLSPRDPFDPNDLYAPDGPVVGIQESFLRQGQIEQEAGLQSAADVMSAADEIKAQREAAYQRMREDLVSQENMLRELDAQLGALRSMQFDANRLFRNGHGVSLALGMAVGAMQQTINNALFPGSNAPNTAMALVQDAIDRDLREQAVNYQRGVTNLGMARTSYEMARQLGMDHVAAYEYAAATAQDYVARQLNARRLTMGAGVAAEQATRAAEELRMSAMQRRQEALALYAQQTVARRGSGRPQQGQAGVPVFPRAYIRPGVGMSPADVRKQIGDGTWNEIRDVTMGGDRVLSILSRMSAILSSGQGDEYLSATRGELESLAGQLTGAIKQSMQLGALDNGVLTLSNMIVANPVEMGGTSVWAQRIAGQMRALRSETARVVESSVRYLGQGLLEYDPNQTIRAGAPPPPTGFTPEDQPPATGRTRAEEAATAIANNPGAAVRAGMSQEQRAGLDVLSGAFDAAVSTFRGSE